MSRRAFAALRLGLVAAAAIGYDLLSYYSTTHSAARSLGTALALLPLALLLTGLAWRKHVALGTLAASAAAVLLWFAWPLLRREFTLIFLLQQASMWGLLLYMFARSLRRGETPLCTHWADLLHGPLSAAELRYTRRVTLAWCGFFAAMMIIGASLYFLASPQAWSAFNNLWALPLLACMFVGEYLVRHVALPRTAHVGLLAAIRLYSSSRH